MTVRVPKKTAIAPVRYRIEAIDPKGHYFAVVCEVRTPDQHRFDRCEVW